MNSGILSPKMRIIVIGDLHGDYRVTIECLYRAGVITKDLKWNGGETVIVQMGDQIDRVRPSILVNDICPDNDSEICEDEGSDLKIVCFTNSQWKGNGFIIPAGPLREKIESLKNFDIIFINGDPKKNQDILNEIKKLNNNINIFETFYKPSNLKEFDNNANYVAFTGIGNSENFYNIMIENKFKIIKKFSFPDHYTYSNNDLKKILNYAKNNNAKIITTEKDYLRLNSNFIQDVKYLKIELVIPNEKRLIDILIKK